MICPDIPGIVRILNGKRWHQCGVLKEVLAVEWSKSEGLRVYLRDLGELFSALLSNQTIRVAAPILSSRTRAELCSFYRVSKLGIHWINQENTVIR